MAGLSKYMEMMPKDEEGMVGKKPLSMEQLLSGIGPRPGQGAEVLQPAKMPMAEAPITKQAAAAPKAKEGMGAGTQAGIEAGASLLGGLASSAAQRKADLLRLQQQALQSASEGEQAGIVQGGQSRQNALAKLIQSYRAALV